MAKPSGPHLVRAVRGAPGCDCSVLQPLAYHDLEDVEVGGWAGQTEAGSARDNYLGIAASAETNTSKITRVWSS